MTTPEPFASRFRQWLSPFVYLSNNWISLFGVVVVTTSVVFWLFLLPTTLRSTAPNPYIGILIYLILPAVFFMGLVLIPVGIAWRKHRSGTIEDFPPLDFRSLELRRLLGFIAVTTFANVIIAGQLTYSAVTYMDSAGFCGQSCHVMKPEFTAYQHSPHSNVECVMCHTGRGAGSLVRAKLAGVNQVFALAFNTYPRPIPAPVHNMLPARETCETCHSPRAFTGNRLRVISKFAEDEQNTPSKTVLLLHVGGGSTNQGIHGAHIGPGVRIRYAHSDEKRQDIPWVEYRDPAGRVSTFTATNAKGEMPGRLAIREMDCMDCHNRPSHTYEMVERAIDGAMAAGQISNALPFSRKKSLEILKVQYQSRSDAAGRIPAAFENYYRQAYPSVFSARGMDVTRSSEAVLAIYNRNIFPEMNVTWGSYPNNVGHTDFPGCFRCHDDAHVAAGGAKITQDCSACHNMLAMEEASPKILTDLGLEK